MTVRIVTVEREFGSGGAQIAKLLAEKLRWKLWDQLLTTEIARLANCDRSEVQRREERMDPLYYRLLKSFLHGSFEGTVNERRFNFLDADTIFRLAQQVVLDAAAEGNCVIVGRGSAFFLENRQDSFHVFLYAPDEEKVRRLVASGIEETDATQLVETVDQDRADFIKRYFQKVWPCRTRYHLMINSSIGDAAVVETILNGIETIQKYSI